jgi:hypothetical protein
MTELFLSTVIARQTPMCQDHAKRENPGEKTLLSSLTLEVDDIFFNLRKADQIIRRELKLLNQEKYLFLKKTSITPINEERFKKIIDNLLEQQFLVDEYIIYMLKNENNSIFKLIKEYNDYIDKRKTEQEDNNLKNLIKIDEGLVDYIRHLGAMIYHLNIHLNMLNIMLKNSSVGVEIQQKNINDHKEAVSESMANEGCGRQQDVRFIEITIDGSYAIVTWALEDLRGDAILQQDEGYWQLMNISTGSFGVEDFQNVDVPLEVAQRMLTLHHQKLGY